MAALTVLAAIYASLWLLDRHKRRHDPRGYHTRIHGLDASWLDRHHTTEGRTR